jgi:hypothetical protein
MNLFSAARRSAPVFPSKCEAGVFHQPCGNAEIARHARRGLNRIVSDHADQYQRLAREPGFKIGADEGVVGSFSDDRLAGKRQDFGLEIISGLSGAIACRRVYGIVPDMDDRPAIRPPMR